MNYEDIRKLVAFFSALKDTRFKANLNQIPSFTVVAGQRMPVDKTYCLELLRKFPEFQGEKFKDDNAIIQYFQKPVNRMLILNRFSLAERAELENFLAFKPTAEELVEQPAGQEVQPGVQETQPVAGGEPASTMGGGMPLVPGGISIPRVIRNIPRAPEVETPSTKSELVTANKSGVVQEAGEPSKLVTANKSGMIEEKPPSKLYVADKSGNVTGERPIGGQSIKPAVEQPKIYIANKSGTVIGEHTIPAQRRFNFPILKSSVVSGFKKVQNLVSRINPALKRGLSAIRGGLGQMIGGLGRNIASPMLTGASRLGSRVAAGSINAGLKISAQISGPRLSLGGPSKRVWIWALGIFLFVFFVDLGVSISAPSQTTPPSDTTPSQPPSQSAVAPGLDYTLPLKDPSITPLDIKAGVLAAFPLAKIEYWDLIVQKSIEANFNPALTLALWIEETGASQTTVQRNGGSGVPTPSGELTLGHLGCAPKEDQTIEESLTCLFKFVQVNNFTNNQFTDFMIKYAGGTPGQPVLGNDNFPKFPIVVKEWYSRLAPSGSGAITPLLAQPLGCPAIGEISTPYGFNIPDYPDVANEGCGSLTRCHNGIDIAASIGTPVKTAVSGTVSTVSSDNLKGNFLEITDQSSNLVITLEHLETITKIQGSTVTKGEVVGTAGATGSVTGPVLHYKIRRGGVLINPLRTLGQSATLNSNALVASDDISQNNYSSVNYTGANWGGCNQ